MTSEDYTPVGHYVYIHRKKTTGEVFYVGKGSGPRRYRVTTGRNDWWKAVVGKHGFIAEIVQDGMQEHVALDLEVQLIHLYGRKDLGLGPLVNLTDGGEGQSNPSEEVRVRLRERSRVMHLYPEYRQKLRDRMRQLMNDPKRIEKCKESLHSEISKRKSLTTRLPIMQSDSYRSAMRSAISEKWKDLAYAEKQRLRLSTQWSDQEYREKTLLSREGSLTEERRTRLSEKMTHVWSTREKNFLDSFRLKCKNSARTKSKPVMCVENGMSFISIKDAVRWLDEIRCGKSAVSRANVRNAINTGGVAYGFHWRNLISDLEPDTLT